jgi:hypothetical protein
MTELIIRIIQHRHKSSLTAGPRSLCAYGEASGADLRMVSSQERLPVRNEQIKKLCFNFLLTLGEIPLN